MRSRTTKHFYNYVIEVLVVSICLFTENSFALTHVVMFGGTLGFTYSPSSFSASVGDTVKWEGAFSTHPLSSTTIPATAASWHSETGSVFTYVITVAGTYHYQCDVHFSLGMTGSFTASATTINAAQRYPQQGNFSMTVLSLQGKNIVRFTIPYAANVMIDVFDMKGRAISRILSQSLQAGSHQALLGPFPKSLYCLKLYAGGNSLVRTLQVVK